MFNARELQYIREVFGIDDLAVMSEEDFRPLKRKAFQKWHPDKRTNEEWDKANKRFAIIKKLADRVDFFLRMDPKDRAQVTGQVMVSRPIVDFGRVFVGDRPVQSTRVWTPTEDAEAWQFIAPKENWLTLQKDADQLEIQINARRPGEYESKVAVWVSGEWTEVKVRVEIMDRAPIKVSQRHIDFGKVPEGDSFAAQIEVQSEIEWSIDHKPDWLEVEVKGKALHIRTIKMECGSFLDKIVLISPNPIYKPTSINVTLEVYPNSMFSKFKTRFMTGGLP